MYERCYHIHKYIHPFLFVAPGYCFWLLIARVIGNYKYSPLQIFKKKSIFIFLVKENSGAWISSQVCKAIMHLEDIAVCLEGLINCACGHWKHDLIPARDDWSGLIAITSLGSFLFKNIYDFNIILSFHKACFDAYLWRRRLMKIV